jgi:predicted nucleotidyltransferase/DNA-binding XRE family transcriptional regulator
VETAGLIRDARLQAGLTQEELAARARTSQPAVARYEQGKALPTLLTLERLLKACGRQAVISTSATAEPQGPRTAPVRQVGVRSRLLRRRIRLLAAAKRRGVRNVRVFGSLVRGEEHADSDVDLLVDLQPGRTLLDLAAFRREASGILGVKVDVATPDMLKERVRAEIEAQATSL